jgi:uncharacterized repeat protein (TIGR03943 family)
MNPTDAGRRLDIGRLARAALLAGFGLLVTKLFVTGQMVKYMSSSVDALTAAAAIATLLMAVVEARGSRSPVAGEAGHPASGEAAERALSYALVAATLVLGLLMVPRTLGTAALGGEDLANYLLAFQPVARPLETVQPAPPDKPVADVPELIVYLDRVGEAGVGQPVRVAGLVASGGRLAPGELALLRYTIVHCVADARPIGLLLTDVTSAVEQDQWVQVEGVVGVRERAGLRLLTIEARSVTPTEQPADPYLHPSLTPS